jgi:hypothetical protein
LKQIEKYVWKYNPFQYSSYIFCVLNRCHLMICGDFFCDIISYKVFFFYLWKHRSITHSVCMSVGWLVCRSRKRKLEVSTDIA